MSKIFDSKIEYVTNTSKKPTLKCIILRFILASYKTLTYVSKKSLTKKISG